MQKLASQYCRHGPPAAMPPAATSPGQAMARQNVEDVLAQPGGPESAQVL